VQVFLIRHPRPLIEDGICYGRLDVGSEDPQPIAARLRGLLPAATPLLASPLQRARQLAAALHPAPRFDARLMEIDFGDWEGRRWADLDRALLDAWAADVLHFAPPGGESAAMLQARAVACFDEHAAALAGERLALVAHSGVLRALLGHWLQLPVAEWSQLKFEFGRVSLIELASDGLSQGDLSHGPFHLRGAPQGHFLRGATLRYMNR